MKRIRAAVASVAVRLMDRMSEIGSAPPVRVAYDADHEVKENGARFDEAQREYAEQCARPVDESAIEILHRCAGEDPPRRRPR